MEKRQGTGDSQLRQRKRAGKGLMEGKDKRENLKGQGEKRDRRHGERIQESGNGQDKKGQGNETRDTVVCIQTSVRI